MTVSNGTQRTGIALSVGAFEKQQLNRVTKLKLKI